MSLRCRRWINQGVFLVAAGFAIWALRDVQFGPAFARLGWGAWIAIALLSVLSTGFTLLPSWFFVQQAGHRVPLVRFFGIVLASQAVNAANPLRMGFPMRVYLLRERLHVAVSTASLLIPLEVFMSISVAACAALVAGPLHATAGHERLRFALAGAGLAGALAAVFVGHLAARRPILISRRLPERVARVVESIQSALAHLTPASLGAFAFFFLLSDTAVAGILKVAAAAAGFHATILFLLAAYCTAYLVGIVSLVPQGFGTRDATLGVLLHAGGATPEQAASAVLIVRASTTGLSFLAGLVAASVMGFSRSASVMSAAKARRTAADAEVRR